MFSIVLCNIKWKSLNLSSVNGLYIFSPLHEQIQLTDDLGNSVMAKDVCVSPLVRICECFV